MVRIPCDTIALAHSADLPKSIYEEGETVFGSFERDALVAEALTLGAQPGFAPQRATISYGLPYSRFNRIEGFSPPGVIPNTPTPTNTPGSRVYFPLVLDNTTNVGGW